MNPMRRICIFMLLLILFSMLFKESFSQTALSNPALQLSGRNDTVPGKVRTPFPTTINLAVEWLIEGDDNLNSVVKVKYRKIGDERWKRAMPLRRVPGGIWKDDRPNPTKRKDWQWHNKHSGSLFDLQPDTEYEIALSLNDPDGGSVQRVVHAKTRPVPEAMPDARIIKVDPGNFSEKVEQAEPGDLFLLAPGNYGMFTATKDGAPGKPIVFRADPKARFGRLNQHKGDALFEGISLQGRKYVYLEGLVSFGAIDLFYAEQCVVRRCRVYGIFGIISSTGSLSRWAPKVAARLHPKLVHNEPPYCTNCYIADNIVVGLTPWTNDALASDGKNMGEGIQITGPGNVICYNRVSGFRDCISTMEDQYAVNQVCIDIYNNDIFVGADDGIEADFCMGNCRVFRNRITNCYNALSSQPGLGGPTFFIRNVMYNIISNAYKLMRGTSGDVFLHNTVVKTGDGASCRTSDPIRFAFFRNNLAVGGKGLGTFGNQRSNGFGWAANFPSIDETCDLDYNGYGVLGLPFKGNIGGKMFTSLRSLRETTSEKHGVCVSMDVFAKSVEFPIPPLKEWPPQDLRLKPGSAAVDAGVIIPNINDDYNGKSPDLGAYELDEKIPVYGPRY